MAPDHRVLRELWFGHAGQTLFQNLDILALSPTVPAEMAVGYLVFPRIAASLGLVLEALRLVFEPSFTLAVRDSVTRPVCAQINGCFAIFGTVGALALLVMMLRLT